MTKDTLSQPVQELGDGFVAYLNRLHDPKGIWLVYNLALQTHVAMPAWWTPEKRWADKCSACGKVEDVAPNDHIGDCLCGEGEFWNHVTASLETGEEVPA